MYAPETCRNSPVFSPYRFTECSKARSSVEPFSCTRSKVPPKGNTEIRSSVVIEPADRKPIDEVLLTERRTVIQKGGLINIDE